MSAPELPVPLSAVALRLTDEVGQAVLEWVAGGDLPASAALDQHVAAVRGELAACRPESPGSARLAGEAAGQRVRPASGALASPVAASPVAASPLAASPVAACPDTPFADSAWYADTTPPLRLLLHYACGFVEAAVRADWWPGETAATGPVDFEALRLAAVCRLVSQAESAAALPPDLP
jgi:Family of unknown function (DUF6401)